MTTDPIKALEEWIEDNFSGHGMAMRRKEDPPIPGEPLMSMAIAKDLTRQAVIAFTAPPASPAPVDDRERVRAAKIEAFDEALSIAEGSYSYGEQQNEIIAGIRAALAAINGEK